jgi:hypothetical protein
VNRPVLMVGTYLVLGALHPAAALDPVSMQLKWKHQFQFAAAAMWPLSERAQQGQQGDRVTPSANSPRS